MLSAEQIEIRRATPDDAAFIAKVLHESFVVFKPLYTEAGFLATTPNEQQVLARMREGPVWVASQKGEVIGTVAIVLQDESAYIRGMAVLPWARGTGAGSALLRNIESWAIDAACVRLFLSTTPFLSDAIRLYERFGFQRTEEGPHDLFGTPLLTMEKHLPAQLQTS
jgi:N-acetylglutamate synthase-like GNAT family acetyltransferase